MFESSARAREVLADTDQIVAQDRKLTVRLLKNLHEIEKSKFYLILACSSMFDYCTRHLKYSEPSALRRIRSARCLAEYPQLLPLLESGDVNPTTVSMVAAHMKPDNASAIIDAIKGKSRREVECFVAGLQPLSIIPPDRTRPVVVPVPTCAKSTSTGDGNNSSTVHVSTPGEDSPHPAITPCEPQQFQRMTRIEFTVHDRLMVKLERIRLLMSHRLPANASLEQLIDYMAEYLIHREDPEARQHRRESRTVKANATKEATVAAKSRQIPAGIRDEVFVRDKQCTYVSPDGRRCESRHVLQVDHVKPMARGGASTVDNLRLLCAYHNRLEAERLMGVRPRRKPAVGT